MNELLTKNNFLANSLDLPSTSIIKGKIAFHGICEKPLLYLESLNSNSDRIRNRIEIIESGKFSIPSLSKGKYKLKLFSNAYRIATEIYIKSNNSTEELSPQVESSIRELFRLQKKDTQRLDSISLDFPTPTPKIEPSSKIVKRRISLRTKSAHTFTN